MLNVKDLKVSFQTRRGQVDAVRGVTFELDKGETLGIVGESGSGKSVTSYALMRILDKGGTITGGALNYEGVDLKAATESAMRDIRGREISMIFQNPRAALNPIRKVGHQLEDVLRRHARATRSTAKAEAIRALEAVKIRNPEERYHAYPFELSGGMCQRIVIAIALACDPHILISDEPTTGLDVQSSRAIKDKIIEMTREHGRCVLVTTHDMHVAQELCDRIGIIHHGELITCKPTEELLEVFSDQVYVFKLDQPVAPEAFSNIEGVLATRRENGFDGPALEATITADDAVRSRALYQLVERLKAQGVGLRGINQRQKNLEQVFLQLTGAPLDLPAEEEAV